MEVVGIGEGSDGGNGGGEACVLGMGIVGGGCGEVEGGGKGEDQAAANGGA